MSTSPPDPEGSTEQQSAITASRGDRDRALEALQALEAATGAPGPGRDEAWRSAVVAALGRLRAALAEQATSYDGPASLMAQLAQDDPRLRTWVRQLHHRWRDLEATAGTLADHLQAAGAHDRTAIAEIREQVRWLATALHHHRSREADLIYQALGIDISGPREGGPSQQRAA
jgi:nitroreductase